MGTEGYIAKGNKHLDVDQMRLLPYHRQIGEMVVTYAPGADARVLDIGCGMGQIEKYLTDAGWPGKVHVADAYDLCLDASAAFPVVADRLKISETDFDIAEQVGDMRFDCIVMSHVLEHLHDPSGKLKLVLSLLKPGGIAIVAVPNPARPMVLIGNLFRRHYANRGHVQTWDPSHWRVFLEEALGLDVAEYRADFVDLPKCRRFPILLRAGEGLARIAPWWSFSNIAAIRAPHSNEVHS